MSFVPEDLTAVADTIRTARERLGISQGKLARLLSLKQQSISKWEGAAAKPDPERVAELHELLHFSKQEQAVIAAAYPRVFERVKYAERAKAKGDSGEFPAGFRRKWGQATPEERAMVMAYLDGLFAARRRTS